MARCIALCVGMSFATLVLDVFALLALLAVQFCNGEDLMSRFSIR
jgi:hypothetical protein